MADDHERSPLDAWLSACILAQDSHQSEGNDQLMGFLEEITVARSLRELSYAQVLMSENRTFLNIAIIVALSALVAFVPGSVNGADVIAWALWMVFLGGICFAAFMFYRRRHVTLFTMPLKKRASLYLSGLVLIFAVLARERVWEWPAGVVIWLAVIAICGFVMFSIWRSETQL